MLEGPFDPVDLPVTAIDGPLELPTFIADGGAGAGGSSGSQDGVPDGIDLPVAEVELLPDRPTHSIDGSDPNGKWEPWPDAPPKPDAPLLEGGSAEGGPQEKPVALPGVLPVALPGKTVQRGSGAPGASPALAGGCWKPQQPRLLHLSCYQVKAGAAECPEMSGWPAAAAAAAAAGRGRAAAFPLAARPATACRCKAPQLHSR